MGLFWNSSQQEKDWKKARKFADRQQFKESETLFLSALEVEPNNPHLMHDYGFMLMGAGRDVEAEQTLEQALALDNSVALTHRSLALAKVRLGKLDEASEHMLQWWLREPSLDASIHNMAAVMGSHNRIVEATFFARMEYERRPMDVSSVRTYQVLLAQLTGVEHGPPDDPLPQLAPYAVQLAVQLFGMGHHQLAADLCARASHDDPGYHEAKIVLSGFLIRAEQYDAALAWVKEVVDLDPRIATAQYNMGLASTRLGDHKSAREAYERTVAIDPEYAEAWRVLGDNYADAGEISKAAEAFQKGYELAPDDFRQVIGLARIRFLNGEPTLAKMLLRDAIVVSPECAILHNNLGIILAELGEEFEARTCFETALAIEPRNASFKENLRNLG